MCLKRKEVAFPCDSAVVAIERATAADYPMAGYEDRDCISRASIGGCPVSTWVSCQGGKS